MKKREDKLLRSLHLKRRKQAIKKILRMRKKKRKKRNIKYKSRQILIYSSQMNLLKYLKIKLEDHSYLDQLNLQV